MSSARCVARSLAHVEQQQTTNKVLSSRSLAQLPLLLLIHDFQRAHKTHTHTQHTQHARTQRAKHLICMLIQPAQLNPNCLSFSRFLCLSVFRSFVARWPLALLSFRFVAAAASSQQAANCITRAKLDTHTLGLKSSSSVGW